MFFAYKYDPNGSWLAITDTIACIFQYILNICLSFLGNRCIYRDITIFRSWKLLGNRCSYLEIAIFLSSCTLRGDGQHDTTSTKAKVTTWKWAHSKAVKSFLMYTSNQLRLWRMGYIDLTFPKSALRLNPPWWAACVPGMHDSTTRYARLDAIRQGRKTPSPSREDTVAVAKTSDSW